MTVHEALRVKVSESLEDRLENIASFRGSEWALRKKLREIFFGVFRDNVEQGKALDLAAAGLEEAKHTRMRELRGALPARKLEPCVAFIHLDKLDCRSGGLVPALGQEDGTVFRPAQVLTKWKLRVDNLTYPMFPGFGHSCTPACPSISGHHCTLGGNDFVLYRCTGSA